MSWGRNAGKRKRPGKLIRAEVKMEVQGWTVWHSCVSGVFRHLISCSRLGLSFVHNGHAPARGGPAWGARAGTNVGHGGVTHVCLATKEASGKPGRAEPRWPRLRASQQSFQPACSAHPVAHPFHPTYTEPSLGLERNAGLARRPDRGLRPPARLCPAA
jgi:hypothetical protein